MNTRQASNDNTAVDRALPCSLCLHPGLPLPQPCWRPPPCRLGVREEAGHDGVLLMDRVMSTSLQLAPDLLDLLAVGCVVIAAKQVGFWALERCGML